MSSDVVTAQTPAHTDDTSLKCMVTLLKNAPYTEILSVHESKLQKMLSEITNL